MSNGEVRGTSPGHAVVTATAPWGRTVAADVFVTADLLVASNRSGAFGSTRLAPSAPTRCSRSRSTAAGRQAVRSPDRTRIVYSSTKAEAPTSTSPTPTAGTRIGSPRIRG